MVLPGGFGTLDEASEAMTPHSDKEDQGLPRRFVGERFWEPFREFVDRSLLGQRTVDPADIERMVFTDSPAEVARLVTASAIEKFGLTYTPLPRRRWWRPPWP